MSPDQMTEAEILDAMEGFEDELEDLNFEATLRYLVDEGFISIEQDESGEFTFHPEGDAEYLLEGWVE